MWAAKPSEMLLAELEARPERRHPTGTYEPPSAVLPREQLSVEQRVRSRLQDSVKRESGSKVPMAAEEDAEIRR